MVVETADCPYATENNFATETLCKETCPVKMDTIITIAPSEGALQEFLSRHDVNVTSGILKERFRRCHTIYAQDNAGPQFRTLCGELVDIKRDVDDGYYYLNDQPIMTFFVKGKRLILPFDGVLGEPWETAAFT